MKSIILIFIYLMLSFVIINGQSLTVLYVSPTGNDGGLGNQSDPLATIQEAQTRVRKLVSGMTADIEVRLMPGVYFLAKPLSFNQSDGGTGGFVVRYRCQGLPGEARIIYGKVLTDWKSWKDGIWSCQVGNQPFLSLYENDRRATLARHPNKEFDADYPCWDGPYYKSVNADVTDDSNYSGQWIQYNANEFDPASISRVNLNLMIFPFGSRDWTKSMIPIKEIQSDNKKIILNDKRRLGTTEGDNISNRFYYCNSLDLLDAPGEYFHDTVTGVLYYKPFTDVSRARVIRPLGHELISVKGTTSASVKNIVFDGLRFEYGDLGSGLAPTDDFRQMVMLENASGITFSCCVFSLGRTGLMAKNSQNIRVQSCLFRKMGVSGVVFNGCTNSRVVDCRFEEVATTLLYGYGIYLKSCVNCVVENSEVCFSGRYALSLRGNVKVQKGTNPDNYDFNSLYSKGNRFRYLKFMHGGQDSGDMGVLHMAALNLEADDNINYVDQVTVSNSWAHDGLTDPDHPWGLYVDWIDNSWKQEFRNVHLEQVQNMVTYTGSSSSHKKSAYFNGQNNRLSAVLFNNSFTNTAGGSNENPGFDRSLMEYGQLGVRNIPQGFLRRSCIAHWAFDEANGNALLQTIPNRVFEGLKLDAEWGGPNAVARVDGVKRKALRFENATNSVTTQQRVNAMLDFSILCWVRLPVVSSSVNATIWSTSQRGEGSGLFCQYLFSNGKPGFGFEVEAQKTAVAVTGANDNAWHLVAAVKSADSIRFYLDGKKFAAILVPTTLRTGELRFGKHPMHTFGSFLGDIDEVRVYNYAITPAMLTLMESSERSGLSPQAFILMNTRSELALEEVSDGVVKAVDLRNLEDGQVWLKESAVNGRFLLRNLRSGRYLIYQSPNVTTAAADGTGWTQLSSTTTGLNSVRFQIGSLFLSAANPVFGGNMSMLSQTAQGGQDWLLIPAQVAGWDNSIPAANITPARKDDKFLLVNGNQVSIIESTGEFVTVYNLSGQLVIKSNKAVFNLEQSGWYLVKKGESVQFIFIS